MHTRTHNTHTCCLPHIWSPFVLVFLTARNYEYTSHLCCSQLPPPHCCRLLSSAFGVCGEGLATPPRLTATRGALEKALPCAQLHP